MHVYTCTTCLSCQHIIDCLALLDSEIEVAYMKNPSSENYFKVSKEYSREELWDEVFGNAVSHLDSVIPFQPEEHNYFLSSGMSKGIYFTQ